MFELKNKLLKQTNVLEINDKASMVERNKVNKEKMKGRFKIKINKEL